MQKRKILILIIMAFVMALSLTLASCVTPEQGHTHTYSQEWKSNETNHWKECACGEKTLEAAHTVDEWTTTAAPTELQAGEQQGECTFCKRTVTRALDKLTHAHDYSKLGKNDKGHWDECACGEKTNFQTHSVVSWTIVKESTETAEGLRRGKCSDCDYDVEQVIPVLGHEHEFFGEWSFDEDMHWAMCECGEAGDYGLHEMVWVIDVPATATSFGSKHSECSVCHMIGEENVIIDMLGTSPRTIDFYAINDFHGEVGKMSQFGGYLKERKNQNPNTIILSSGDMFQGSMESNSNYGKLLSNCMEVAGFDAFTFGNHEFDWGLDNLRKLAGESKVPFLGANIYKWNAQTKQFGEFASDLAKEYEIKVLENGLKVGIIGVIGSNQITSISSNLVQTIGFKDPLPIVKEVSARLRNQHGCDVVAVSIHAPSASWDGSALDGYVDAVFSAHNHAYELGTYQNTNIPYIQSSHNGEAVSHIQLKVNSNNDVSCEKQEHVYYDQNWPNLAEATTLINNSNAQIEEQRNQTLAYFDNYLSSSVGVPRLVSRAIAEYAADMGYEITLSMVNTGRSSLSRGYVTYSNLYEAIPFDNVIYVAEVLGSDLLYEAEYKNNGSSNYSNAIWRVSGEPIESDKYYKIAIIDYLIFHQNSYRNYDYFPSAFEGGRQPVALTPVNNANYNYRDITKQYLLDNANSFTAYDYTATNNNNDNSLLRQEVELSSTGGGGTPSIVTAHAGTLTDPYDVADALLLAAASTESAGAPSGYVVGKVTIVGSYTPRQGNSTDDLGRIYIEDDKGNIIYVYWLSKFNGATKGDNWDWTGVSSDGYLPNDLKVGDTIVLYAKSIYTYTQYGSTPQVYTAYCVSINGEPTQTV